MILSLSLHIGDAMTSWTDKIRAKRQQALTLRTQAQLITADCDREYREMRRQRAAAIQAVRDMYDGVGEVESWEVV